MDGKLYTISKNQRRAMEGARAMQQSSNGDEMKLDVQDIVREAGYVIYIYNVLNKEHDIGRDTKLGRRIIAPCPAGEKFSWTTIPAFTKETFVRHEQNEIYYKVTDGRKDATTLLNAYAYPGTDWDAQLADWTSQNEEALLTGTGNNLNSFGVFWSLTEPRIDAPSRHIKGGTLADEIERFKAYVTRTMNGLVKQAELYVAAGKLVEVTPNMHFAMDYLGKKAAWHMSMDHMVSCPTCGEAIKDGIAYHRNAFNERCIVDFERCVKLGIIKPETEEVPAQATERKAPRRKSA